MKRIFWEILARLGFWIPVKHYLPDRRYWDWVLISAINKAGGFRGIPEVGEYLQSVELWHTAETDDYSFYAQYFYEYKTVTHWHKLPRRLK